MNISTLLKSIKLLLIGVTIVFMSACKGPDINRFHGLPDKGLNKRDVVYLAWEVETLPIATSFDVRIESTPPLDIASDLEKRGDLAVQVFETTEFVLTARQAVLGFSYTTTETLVVEVNDPTDLATLQFHDENLEECIHRTAAEKNIVYVEDVVELDCSNSQIGMLKGIEQLMNLEKLVLKNNYLGYARENILLPKLKYLDVSSNFINSLSDVIEIDAWNTKLEVLIVADNPLSVLSISRVVRELSELDILRILNLNGLSADSHFSLHDFPNLGPSLEQLYLDEVRLFQLPDLPEGLTHLSARNSYLYQDVNLKAQANLEYLDLSQNMFSNLTLSEEIRGLKYLDLSDSLLIRESTVRDLISKNRLLEHIGLEGFCFRDDRLFSHDVDPLLDILGLDKSPLPLLRSLNLSDSCIDSIEALSSLAGLKELRIADTEVRELDVGLNWDEFTLVDFSNTQVKDIEVLDNNSMLEEVNFSNLKELPLADISDLLVRNQHTISRLYLSGLNLTGWTEDGRNGDGSIGLKPGEVFLPEALRLNVTHLDLSHNSIGYFPGIDPPPHKNFPALIYLDIGYNENINYDINLYASDDDPKLEYLDISKANVYKYTLPWFPKLSTFAAIDATGITKEDILSVSRYSPNIRNLRASQLDSINDLKFEVEEGTLIRELVLPGFVIEKGDIDWRYFANLQRLEIEGGFIEDLNDLTFLYLRYLNLENTSLTSLRDVDFPGLLSELNISNNPGLSISDKSEFGHLNPRFITVLDVRGVSFPNNNVEEALGLDDCADWVSLKELYVDNVDGNVEWLHAHSYCFWQLRYPDIHPDYPAFAHDP